MKPARSQFAARQVSKPAGAQPVDPPPELSAYRDHTVALLRRYARLAVEVGRLPSLLGREFFRARVTSYRLTTFEEIVIFVHDIETCVEHLDGLKQQLIARIALEQYTYDEAACLLQVPRRTLVRRYLQAFDQLSDMFLQRKLLAPFDCSPPKRRHERRPALIREISACAGQDSEANQLGPVPALPGFVKPMRAPTLPQPPLLQDDIGFAKMALAPF